MLGPAAGIILVSLMVVAPLGAGSNSRCGATRAPESS